MKLACFKDFYLELLLKSGGSTVKVPARHEIENLLTGDIDPDNLEIYMAVSEKIRKKEEEIV